MLLNSLLQPNHMWSIERHHFSDLEWS